MPPSGDDWWSGSPLPDRTPADSPTGQLEPRSPQGSPLYPSEALTSPRYPLLPSPVRGGKRRRGFLGSLVAGAVALFKSGFLLLKLGAFKGTLITMAISAVVYSIFFGPVFAVAFVLLILVHEMGHYLVARRLGVLVSAPLFVPLFGALINMRRQPRSVEQEATMALAGPLTGLAASWLCLVPALLFHSQFWAALGYLGCLLNLFNLIPASPLDGGRITAAISKWANLVGLLILGLYAIWSTTVARAASPVLLIIVIFAVLGTFSRFRQARRTPEYLTVSPSHRWLMLGFYLALVAVAVWGLVSGNSYLSHVHALAV